MEAYVLINLLNNDVCAEIQDFVDGQYKAEFEAKYTQVIAQLIDKTDCLFRFYNSPHYYKELIRKGYKIRKNKLIGWTVYPL